MEVSVSAARHFLELFANLSENKWIENSNDLIAGIEKMILNISNILLGHSSILPKQTPVLRGMSQ